MIEETCQVSESAKEHKESHSTEVQSRHTEAIKMSEAGGLMTSPQNCMTSWARIKQETADNELQNFAHRAMNELLSLYGYDHVIKSDITNLCLSQSDGNSENDGKRSDADGDDVSSCPDVDSDNVCSWCGRDTKPIFVFKEEENTKSFCCEKCFAAFRRAKFKNSKIGRETGGVSSSSSQQLAKYSETDDVSKPSALSLQDRSWSWSEHRHLRRNKAAKRKGSKICVTSNYSDIPAGNQHLPLFPEAKRCFSQLQKNGVGGKTEETGDIKRLRKFSPQSFGPPTNTKVVPSDLHLDLNLKKFKLPVKINSAENSCQNNYNCRSLGNTFLQIAQSSSGKNIKSASLLEDKFVRKSKIISDEALLQNNLGVTKSDDIEKTKVSQPCLPPAPLLLVPFPLPIPIPIPVPIFPCVKENSSLHFSNREIPECFHNKLRNDPSKSNLSTTNSLGDCAAIDLSLKSQRSDQILTQSNLEQQKLVEEISETTKSKMSS